MVLARTAREGLQPSVLLPGFCLYRRVLVVQTWEKRGCDRLETGDVRNPPFFRATLRIRRSIYLHVARCKRLMGSRIGLDDVGAIGTAANAMYER